MVKAVKFNRDRNPAYTAVGKVEDNTLVVKNNGMGFNMEYANEKIGVFLYLHSQQKLEGTGSR